VSRRNTDSTYGRFIISGYHKSEDHTVMLPISAACNFIP